MERRVGADGGAECIISNLKAELGQLKSELKRMQMKLGKNGAEEVDEALYQAEEEKEELEPDAELLGEEDKKIYQRNAARANYICLDRPDIGFATKEAMRRLS